MNMIRLLIFVLLFSPLILNAQFENIAVDSLNRYQQIQIGLSYNNFNGEVSNFTKHGGALDMYFAYGRNQHLFGFNMNVIMSNKVMEFSIPPDFEHYSSPATLFFGSYYGQLIGDQHQSHFTATIGLNYGWLLHRKDGDRIGGYHGFIPQIEFSRSIRIGEPRFSTYQFTSQFTPPRYDPSITNNFIDVFVGYRKLFLNNEEGRGSLFSFGVRFKINKYSIERNLAQ